MAISPSPMPSDPVYDLQVVPRRGYRHDVYHDADSRCSVPVLMGAATREELFEVFMDLLDPLGSEVDVVLETSHNREARGHVDLYREHIDTPVLKSILWEYEELLLNDGCVGIAVLNPSIPQEVQFDEHKLLIVYGEDLRGFEQVFDERNIPCDDQMKFITEAEHVHSSSDQFFRQFEELKMAPGNGLDVQPRGAKLSRAAPRRIHAPQSVVPRPSWPCPGVPLPSALRL